MIQNSKKVNFKISMQPRQRPASIYHSNYLNYWPKNLPELLIFRNFQKVSIFFVNQFCHKHLSYSFLLNEYDRWINE